MGVKRKSKNVLKVNKGENEKEKYYKKRPVRFLILTGQI